MHAVFDDSLHEFFIKTVEVSLYSKNKIERIKGLLKHDIKLFNKPRNNFCVVESQNFQLPIVSSSQGGLRFLFRQHSHNILRRCNGFNTETS